MKCPFCGFAEDKVVDSRESKEGESIRRRRECLKCEKRFTTYERIDEIPYMVVKKDGRREKFERQKVLNGLLRACEKRPVSIGKLEQIVNDTERWIARTFHTPKWKVDAWVAKTQKQGMDESGTVVITKTVSTIGGIFMTFLIMPVYVFMIIYYKPLLFEFFARLFPKTVHGTVVDVLKETKALIQSYLYGLVVEALLVATLNSVALWILGIDYAILIGVIGALLNVIPYIGGVIAVTLPMLLALATKQPIDAFYVLIAYLIVQFIDNNFFVPKIVASKVKINALVSIIVVLVGNELWGVPGMFLSIPITAIIKVIFDRVGPLQPFGFLLGDNQPDITQEIFVVRRKRKVESK